MHSLGLPGRVFESDPPTAAHRLPVGIEQALLFAAFDVQLQEFDSLQPPLGDQVGERLHLNGVSSSLARDVPGLARYLLALDRGGSRSAPESDVDIGQKVVRS